MKAADDAGIETLVNGLKGRITDLEGQLATVTAALSLICSTDSTGAYTGLKLPDGIVTEAKLDQAVKTKLTESIGNARILDGAVTSAKIADKTIQNVDLADGIVTSAKIADGTIANVDIANGTIAPAKLTTAAQYLLNGGGGFFGAAPSSCSRGNRRRCPGRSASKGAGSSSYGPRTKAPLSTTAIGRRSSFRSRSWRMPREPGGSSTWIPATEPAWRSTCTSPIKRSPATR